MVGAFGQATLGGCIAEETLRAIRFNFLDVTLHADAIHRGAGQLMPPTKRVMYACQLVSKPILMEPMYVCDITVPTAAVSGVYETLNARRGQVEGQDDRPGTPLTKVKAYLPVLESCGFASFLRQKTGGQAFPQMIFSHWAPLNGNPLEVGSPAYTQVMAVRERKGLKAELPNFNDFYDKL